MPVTIRLSTPLPGEAAFGDPVTEITLRDPVGRDVRDFGFPVRDNQMDEKRMAAWIAGLAALPPSAVDAMSLQDWMACAMAVSDFFKGPLPSES